VSEGCDGYAAGFARSVLALAADGCRRFEWRAANGGAGQLKSVTDTPEVLRGGAFLLSPLTAAGGFDSLAAGLSAAGFAGASSRARGGGLAAWDASDIGRAMSVGIGSCDFAVDSALVRDGGFGAAGFFEAGFGCFSVFGALTTAGDFAVFGVLATAGDFAVFGVLAAGGAFAVVGFFAVVAAFGVLDGFAAGGALTAFGGFESAARSGLAG
jgi:hypothetical protein